LYKTTRKPRAGIGSVGHDVLGGGKEGGEGGDEVGAAGGFGFKKSAVEMVRTRRRAAGYRALYVSVYFSMCLGAAFIHAQRTIVDGASSELEAGLSAARAGRVAGSHIVMKTAW
jgi:hypothetical protein